MSVDKKQPAALTLPADSVSGFSVIHFLKQIIQDAIAQNTSDIHFEPCKSYFRIRFRIDGLLKQTHQLSSQFQNAIISRLKIMAELDITERRLPQDGRFTFQTSSITRDCRISSCPSLFGEKMVVRILDSTLNLLIPEELGLNSEQLKIFNNALSQSQGLILVTGPTGSGKTITLYSALNQLNEISRNIATIEDPIEIHLPGIHQVQTNSKIGLTFAKVLRALLRQDPDIILIGEIRDEETAQMAVRAAQTGHLVLASLHTNNATETIDRLINLNVSSINLVNALNTIIAQRLIRKLCERCKTPIPSPAHYYQPQHCPHCIDGFRGRTAIFEILPITTTISEMIANRCSSQQLRQRAKQENMKTLWDSATEKISQGITSLQEIYRTIHPEDSDK